ncbi:hypothetical protein ACQW5G_04335 [Fructilactobacillus sp. Tb1]|uniref:hypothetical protein n=1 Tax=Fructilactobacillus sp. Tb1 TaxID=3422304 RepID=UPI003D2A36E9
MMKYNRTKTTDQIAYRLLDLVSRKHLYDITITELISGPHISRRTFYNHFNSLIDLINYTVQMVNENLNLNFLLKITDKNELEKKTLEYLPEALYNNRDEIKIMYTTDLYGPWCELMFDTYLELIRKVEFDNLPANNINTKITLTIFTYSILSTIKVWISQPIPGNANDLRSMLFRIIYNPKF